MSRTYAYWRRTSLRTLAYVATTTWVPMKDAAADVGVSVEAVRKWVRTGKVPHRERGRAWVVPIERVRKVAAAAPRQRISGAPPAGMALLTLAEAKRLEEMGQQFLDITERLSDTSRQLGYAEAEAARARSDVEKLRAERDRLAAEVDRLQRPWWRRRT